MSKELQLLTDSLGEFLVLRGPSGSGKSTILKLIAGIELPDDGEIWLGGRRIDRLLPRHRDVAMVFQSYALYPHMSVAKKLAFSVESAGVPRGERRQRIEEVVTMLELTDLLKRRPNQLSGGQQQRVALGRAIIRRPQLFLLDEPLSNLDAQLRVRTRLELVGLHERLRATMIYVTHDQTEAMTMGQRVAVIDHGRLHQVGTPEEVYEHPADVVVARFLGSPPMNFLPARVVRDGDGFSLNHPGDTLVHGQAVPAGEVTLGIRAEYLFLDRPEQRPLFSAMVVRVELLGHQRLAYVRLGATTITAWAPRHWAVRVGVDSTGVRLFDSQTGRVLRAFLNQSARAL